MTTLPWWIWAGGGAVLYLAAGFAWAVTYAVSAGNDGEKAKSGVIWALIFAWPPLVSIAFVCMAFEEIESAVRAVARRFDARGEEKPE